MNLAVGFDLDMTLIDARPGMAAVMDLLAVETGLALDGAHFAANLGPPLDMVFRGFEAPEERIPWLIDRFRALYPTVVVPATLPLPGAAEALDAVKAAGGRTMDVTGKYGPNAARHLRRFGWEVDVLVGEVWARAKGVALREHGAGIYVGDHGGDVIGAKVAGALAVGVATGPYTAEQLTAEGADVVLASLTEFPAWLAHHLAATTRPDCADDGQHQSQR